MGLPAATVEAATGSAAIFGAAAATPYPSVGAYCRNGRPRSARPAPPMPPMWRISISTSAARSSRPAPSPPSTRRPRLRRGRPRRQNRDRIRDTVGTLLERGAVPVLIGGDDSVPIPLFRGFCRPWPAVTSCRSMPISTGATRCRASSLGLSSTMRRASEMAQIERIIQVGQRGIGSARVGDFEDALPAGSRFVPASALDASGVGPVVELVPKGRRCIVDFDFDALDPAIMPAMIGPTPGGLPIGRPSASCTAPPPAAASPPSTWSSSWPKTTLPASALDGGAA